MTSRNYYYLVAGFPEMAPDQKKMPFSAEELKQELMIHLHPDDYNLVSCLFLQYDNLNLVNMLLRNGKEFVPLGNFSAAFLTEELREPEKLPAYMKKFLENHREETPVNPKLSLENQLTWHYYDFMLAQKNGFLKKWFWFLRDVNNIFAVYNARKFGFDVESQIIGNYELTEVARKSASKDFGLANEYPYIEDLAEIFTETNIMEQEAAIDRLKWEYLSELNTFNSFSVEKVLELIIKFMMIERWSHLDVNQSKVRFAEILGTLEHSIEFSKDFNINGKRS